MLASGAICDRNACDQFHIKVQGPLVEKDGLPA
jgi:hypothetical protein